MTIGGERVRASRRLGARSWGWVRVGIGAGGAALSWLRAQALDLQGEEVHGQECAGGVLLALGQAPGVQGHQMTEDANRSADDPDRGAGGREFGGRWRLKDAAVAGPGAAAECERLAAPAHSTADHRRDPAGEAGVVDHEFEAGAVGALEDQCIPLMAIEELGQALPVEVDDVGVDDEVVGSSAELRLGGARLGGTDVSDIKEHLSLEVAGFDAVAVDDRQTASTGGEQAEKRRCAEAPRAQHQEVIPRIMRCRQSRHEVSRVVLAEVAGGGEVLVEAEVALARVAEDGDDVFAGAEFGG